MHVTQALRNFSWSTGYKSPDLRKHLSILPTPGNHIPSSSGLGQHRTIPPSPDMESLSQLICYGDPPLNPTQSWKHLRNSPCPRHYLAATFEAAAAHVVPESDAPMVAHLGPELTHIVRQVFATGLCRRLHQQHRGLRSTTDEQHQHRECCYCLEELHITLVHCGTNWKHNLTHLHVHNYVLLKYAQTTPLDMYIFQKQSQDLQKAFSILNALIFQWHKII